MISLTVILIVVCVVAFGMLGWIYMDHTKHRDEIDDYFKNNFDKF